jgi:uncharacterized membrane protein
MDKRLLVAILKHPLGVRRPLFLTFLMETPPMLPFQATLTIATFLCTLVAGFLFAFAVVVMPGIKQLEDGAFLRAFQAMDRIIQNGHPLFMLAWVGSVATLLGATLLGYSKLDPVGRGLLLGALGLYLLGVQLPTVAVHLPMNNRLQAVEVATLDQTAKQQVRQNFESRWNRWNQARAMLSCSAALLLMILLLRQ